MNDPESFKNPCTLCKKRKATKLCDYIVKYDNSIIFFTNYQLFKKVNSPGYKNDTCDLPMCENCAKNIGYELDFCPYHYKLYSQVELPKELQLCQRHIKEKLKQKCMKARL